MRDQSQLDRTPRIGVTVNGAATSFDRGTTVTELLNQLGVASERVAVEVNLTVIDRRLFDQTRIDEGDRVEIVSFVGGGNE